jgi:hypothetical protein
MILESRQFIHMGVNYVVLPAFLVNRQASLNLQQTLLSAGVEFTSCACEGNTITVHRKAPFPLEARFVAPMAQPQPFGQILVLAPGQQWAFNGFCADAEAIFQAFGETWPAQNRRIIACDVTLRCLYQSSSEHAFKELWEQRLSQPSDALSALERKVLGGGLRFVMPPQSGEAEPTQVEVKVESYLQDTTKVFVEIQFAWPAPQPGESFEVTRRLNQVNDYMIGQVHAFMTGGSR